MGTGTYTNIGSAPHGQLQVIQQFKERGLPTAPSHQPVDQSSPALDDLSRDVDHRLAKRLELHTQPFLFRVVMFV